MLQLHQSHPRYNNNKCVAISRANSDVRSSRALSTVVVRVAKANSPSTACAVVLVVEAVVVVDGSVTDSAVSSAAFVV